MKENNRVCIKYSKKNKWRSIDINIGKTRNEGWK